MSDDYYIDAYSPQLLNYAVISNLKRSILVEKNRKAVACSCEDTLLDYVLPELDRALFQLRPW